MHQNHSLSLPSTLIDWLENGDISPGALGEIERLGLSPALLTEAAQRCRSINAKTGLTITEELAKKIINGNIKCDYHADRSLNLAMPPSEFRYAWKYFGRRECRRCSAPGHVLFPDEMCGYREFCIDHECYSKKMRAAREKAEVIG